MPSSKADIISQLQREILPLQGFKTILNSHPIDMGLGPIVKAFPNQLFPTGAIHEFICQGSDYSAPTDGFISGLVSRLMQTGGACVWIGQSNSLFAPALNFYGIDAERILFIDLAKEKDKLWAMEEALKCDALSTVIGEIPEISLINSRRLQLAVEQSRVTGFIIRRNPKIFSSNACIARWMIRSLPGYFPESMPGVGFPYWEIELVKIRNGNPGKWKLAWFNGEFLHLPEQEAISNLLTEHRKTG